MSVVASRVHVHTDPEVVPESDSEPEPEPEPEPELESESEPEPEPEPQRNIRISKPPPMDFGNTPSSSKVKEAPKKKNEPAPIKRPGQVLLSSWMTRLEGDAKRNIRGKFAKKSKWWKFFITLKDNTVICSEKEKIKPDSFTIPLSFAKVGLMETDGKKDTFFIQRKKAYWFSAGSPAAAVEWVRMMVDECGCEELSNDTLIAMMLKAGEEIPVSLFDEADCTQRAMLEVRRDGRGPKEKHKPRFFVLHRSTLYTYRSAVGDATYTHMYDVKLHEVGSKKVNDKSGIYIQEKAGDKLLDHIAIESKSERTKWLSCLREAGAASNAAQFEMLKNIAGSKPKAEDTGKPAATKAATMQLGADDVPPPVNISDEYIEWINASMCAEEHMTGPRPEVKYMDTDLNDGLALIYVISGLNPNEPMPHYAFDGDASSAADRMKNVKALLERLESDGVEHGAQVKDFLMGHEDEIVNVVKAMRAAYTPKTEEEIKAERDAEKERIAEQRAAAIKAKDDKEAQKKAKEEEREARARERADKKKAEKDKKAQEMNLAAEAAAAKAKKKATPVRAIDPAHADVIEWINDKLAGSGTTVRYLDEDLVDGLVLINIINAVSHKPIPAYEYDAFPATSADKMKNLDLAFKRLEADKVHVPAKVADFLMGDEDKMHHTVIAIRDRFEGGRKKVTANAKKAPKAAPTKKKAPAKRVLPKKKAETPEPSDVSEVEEVEEVEEEVPPPPISDDDDDDVGDEAKPEPEPEPVKKKSPKSAPKKVDPATLEGIPDQLAAAIKLLQPWANSVLVRADIEITNFTTDLRDGVALMTLLEIMSGEKEFNFNRSPTTPQEWLANLQKVSEKMIILGVPVKGWTLKGLLTLQVKDNIAIMGAIAKFFKQKQSTKK